ncbi:probable secreted protein [Salmonella enterica subsp. arizonae]|uniref:Probable secreted protein n=1 Tax=Salmonella enterica subsp. arizonae TaxID=59203 RepID=A0A3S4HI68_SALER|nr:probable secreted protein [Salmonella enterica subsp. arizonae]
MVKEAGGWRFDMAAAQEEILTRTLGRNELSTLQAMHAYVDAQQDYYLQNHRWAHKIISSEGQKDGLYWPTKAGEAPSPLGPNFSPAAPDEGYHGYHFRIISDNDGHGTALLAWPMHYGETGVMSFMVNQDDHIYQADLGKDTESKVKAITRFAQTRSGRPPNNP